MKIYFATYFGTILIVMILMPIAIYLAKKFRLEDAPNSRKVHKIPIPRVGGFVLVVATFVPILPILLLNNSMGHPFYSSHLSQTQIIVLLTMAFSVFIVGFIDDLRPLRGYIKLLYLIIVSLIICASGTTIQTISIGPSYVFETGKAAWPLSVLWIVMITICINLIDGLDGLAAGVSAIVSSAIMLLAIRSGQITVAVLMLALIGSLSGFLIFNTHPAKIFMGDGGSMFLGFILGTGSLMCRTKTSSTDLAIPFLILGIPIFDMIRVVIQRLLKKCSVFTADRSHLHHYLLDLGFHQNTVVIFIYTATAISACIGMLVLVERY